MTGDDYLQLSLDAVQQLVDDTRVLQLKEKQCGLLTIELLKVAINVRAAVDRLTIDTNSLHRSFTAGSRSQQPL